MSPPSLTRRTHHVSAPAAGRSASVARSALGRLVISPGVDRLLVQPVPDLVDAVARLAVQQLGQLVAARLVVATWSRESSSAASAAYWSMRTAEHVEAGGPERLVR